MKLIDFLSIINMQVSYRVTDRNTRKAVTLSHNGKPIKEVMQRKLVVDGN